MNDNDLTRRFHEALDDAAPDPLLWNRVESNVNRKTRNRRLAVLAAAAAVPATVAIAAVALTTTTPSTAPDILTVDDAPTITTETATPSPDGGEDAAREPVDLSTVGYAYAEDTAIVLASTDGETLATVALDDVVSIDAVAGLRSTDRDHLALVVRTLDQDGAEELRVDRLSWDRSAGASVSHVTGPTFSQYAVATYSAAFDPEGQLVVLSSAPGQSDTTGVTTVDFPDLRVLGGRDVTIGAGELRLAGFTDYGAALVSSSTARVHTVDLSEGMATEWTWAPAASLVRAGDTTRLLYAPDGDAGWVLREFPDTSDQRELDLPAVAAGLDASELQLLAGPFTTTHLRVGSQLWRLDDTTWAQVGPTSDVTTAFVAAPDLAPPAVEAVDRSAWTADAITEESRIRVDGVAGVRVGMTLAEVRRITGQDWTVNYGNEGFCQSVNLPGVPGIGFLFSGPSRDTDPEDATLGSISTYTERDRDGIDLTTDRGIGLGATAAEVIAAYGELERGNAPYDPDGFVLDHADPASDGGLGVRFVFDSSDTVVAIRAGDLMRKATEGCS